VFTDRRGGESRAPYDSLNLGGHVGDDPDAVAANHRALADALGLPDPAGWVRPFHVHGTDVLEVDAAPPVPVDGDGSATTAPNLPLVTIGADCAPIAIANDTAVAAVHAGWRGALGGVVEGGVAAVRRLGTGPVRAAIGPCICARHYEFGDDALGPLVARFGTGVRAATDAGHVAFDLPGALHVALRDAGVDDVSDAGWVCTFESPQHYSYRRDGVTGRHGVVAVKVS
jgi:YfiH family protein